MFITSIICIIVGLIHHILGLGQYFKIDAYIYHIDGNIFILTGIILYIISKGVLYA